MAPGIAAQSDGRKRTKMEQRRLGSSGLTVSAIGLGCMGMSEFYGPSDDAQSLATLERAFALRKFRGL
jgi:hypothetical protein